VKIKEIQTDFLVIGSGIAGLWFANRAADYGRVTIITKKEDTESNTNYAQGGIAAVMSENDSPEIHYQDTIKAGAGLAKAEIVKMVVEEGTKLVQELYETGIKFSTYNDSFGKLHYDLGKEGGHSRRRIVHSKDNTGFEIENGLLDAVRNKNNVQILENHFIFDLIIHNNKCWGGIIMDDQGEITILLTRVTLMATGGIGSVYLHTTNPKIATGDGIAMAYRANAKIANMEFIQFHPTSLYGKKINDRSFLISEAVRGEGGILKTLDGKTFADKYHELGSLAPRDVVARAIDAEMKIRHEDYVFLDITHLDPELIRNRFPNIYKTCLNFNVDITREKIPVVPAAHYICGGIQINSHSETNIKRLLAAGECACSGMHGANRLASNSLLEALFFAETSAERCRQYFIDSAKIDFGVIKDRLSRLNHSLASKRFQLTDSEKKTLEHLALRLKKTMWDNAGIVRSNQGLQNALQEFSAIEQEVDKVFPENVINPDFCEMMNMLIIAKLITTCAIRRKESRGLHYNSDYPNPDDANFLKETIVTKDEIN
jgi:L-aspartate oxidase